MKYLKAAVEWAREANEIAVDHLADGLSWLGARRWAVALVAVNMTVAGLFIATHPKPKGPQIVASGGMGGFAAPYTLPSQIKYNCGGTGCVSRPIASKLGDVVSVCDFIGATCPTGGDDRAAIQAAITAAGAGTVYFPAGTFMVGNDITLQNQVHLIGAGQRETIIKAINGSMMTTGHSLFKPSGADGWGVSIEKMRLEGNQYDASLNPSGNTQGRAIYWKGVVPNDGPALTLRDVHWTGWSGDVLADAVLIEGNLWVEMFNVRAISNQWARGLYLKTSDSLLVGFYAVSNGNRNGVEDAVFEGGSSTVCVGCYFGGGSGSSELLLKGVQFTTFIGTRIDSAYQHCVRIIDSGATASHDNQFIGGQVTNCSQQTDNTYDHFSIEGASARTVIRGVVFDNTKTNKGRYALTELNTATSTSCSGCQFNTLGTGVNNLRSGSGSRIVESPGYNPQGVAAITVTASPFTYTNNDGTPENIYMYAGTVSGVTKSGTTIFQSSPNDCWLEPGESIIVTYTVAPTMVKDRK